MAGIVTRTDITDHKIRSNRILLAGLLASSALCAPVLAAEENAVTVTGDGEPVQVTTRGVDGGIGSKGGNNHSGHQGHSGTDADDITVSNSTRIDLQATPEKAPDAPDLALINIISTGGHGGHGGKAGWGGRRGGRGGTGGSGGDLDIANDGTLINTLDRGYGIFARSIGGDGGNAGGGGTGKGAAGGIGGNGGEIDVFHRGAITTYGDFADGIHVDSRGGRGGNGAGSGSGSTKGGAGGHGGYGGGHVSADIDGAVTTHGDEASGVYAMSIGGDGGDGGSATGAFVAIGGHGGPGGIGGKVAVNHHSTITTTGNGSDGIHAQSVGGGGGHGGSALDFGVLVGVALGGRGGGGGYASEVDVTLDNQASIATTGTHSSGILAQSIGGGGGKGGNASGLAVGGVSLQMSFGGSGGSGGAGGDVTVDLDEGSAITTGAVTTNEDGNEVYSGDFSSGIVAQSIGGGGGHGGMALALGLAVNPDGPALAAALAFGGSGGYGGNGGNVTLTNDAQITTYGRHATGMLAQSIGGGGGSGGNAISVAVGAGETGGSVSAALGGSGTNGGNGGSVKATNTGAITTHSSHSIGMIAQAIGGGGGTGGNAFSVSTSAGESAYSASVALGGRGGAGGYASNVEAAHEGTITTHGTQSAGALIQSIGGGGGAAGNAYSFAVALGTGSGGDGGEANALNVAIGGTGGDGGAGGGIFFTQTGAIQTSGENSHGAIVQSIGGSGGHGGNVIAVTATGVSGGDQDKEKAKQRNITVAVGGHGGHGNMGGDVYFDLKGDASISTLGTFSHGMLVQSVGGSGGDGGYAEAVSLSKETEGAEGEDGEENEGGKVTARTLTIGGSGGTGGEGRAVNVTLEEDAIIETAGNSSRGILAQSIGGGGGAGGHAHSYGRIFGGNEDDTKETKTNIGGNGGAGNHGGDVFVGAGNAESNNTGRIATTGDNAHAIMAQSIGGGGGAGGTTESALEFGGYDFAEASTDDLQPDDEELEGGNEEPDYSFTAGGQNGAAGNGGYVDVSQSLALTTLGTASFGILAQSIGAGGGELHHGGITASFNDHDFTIGGRTKSNGNGGTVYATSHADITTGGNLSHAILAQSIGGGGGSGTVHGAKIGGDLTLTGQLGGDHGIGNGGQVNLSGYSDLLTYGHQAFGLTAQSVGGGGGESHYGRIHTGSVDIDYQLGAEQYASGDGNNNTIFLIEGSAITLANQSHGLVGQSIGGGGGIANIAGFDASGDAAATYTLGGQTHANGNGGPLSVDARTFIGTEGAQSFGILAHSIGGGGGLLQHGGSTAGSTEMSVAMGGDTHASGAGGAVTIAHRDTVRTLGDQSHGIVAQSIGGGGGVFNAGAQSGDAPSDIDLTVGAVAAGAGGDIRLDAYGNTLTEGSQAFGIIAQSITNGGGLINIDGAGAAFSNPLAIGSAGNATAGTVDLYTWEDSYLRTLGDGAHGILAQSLGGGGLIVSGDTPNTDGVETYARNHAAGGDINVISHGIIETYGRGANGITAISSRGNAVMLSGPDGLSLTGRSGHANSGSVEVFLDGSVSTQGSNSHGIDAYADRNLSEAIRVTLDGDIDVSGPGSIGIRTRNALLNWDYEINSDELLSIIYVLEDASVTASSNDEASAAIDLTEEFGTFSIDIAGDVRRTQRAAMGGQAAIRAAGKGRIQIEETGFILGSIFGDGAGYDLTVLGMIDGYTTGVSDYILQDGATHFIPLNPDNPDVIAIEANRLGTVYGDIRPYLTTFGSFEAPITLISSPTAISESVLSSIHDTAATSFDLSLTQPTTGSDGNTLPGTVTIDEVSVDFQGALTGNAARLGALADKVVATWMAGHSVSAEDQELHDTLIAAANVRTEDTLQTLFADQFDLSQTSAFVVNQHASAVSIINHIHSCGETEGTWAAITETQCNWAKVSGSFSANDAISAKTNSYMLSFGRQTAIAESWRLGFGAGYEIDTFKTPTSRSEGTRLHVGSVAKYTNGPWLASGSLALSHGSSDKERLYDVSESQTILTSDQESWSVSGRLRGARQFTAGVLDIIPMIDLDTTWIQDKGYHEHNANGIDLGVAASDQSLYDLHPAIRLGTDIEKDDSLIRPFFAVGARFALNDAQIDHYLPGSDFNDLKTTLLMPRDDTAGTISAGFKLYSGEHFETRMRFDGTYGDQSRSHRGSIKIGYRF